MFLSVVAASRPATKLRASVAMVKAPNQQASLTVSREPIQSQLRPLSEICTVSGSSPGADIRRLVPLGR